MNKLKAIFNSRKIAFDSDEELSLFFQKNFKVKPKNLELYKQALTHKSKSSEVNNERLEYLGDTLLSSIVASYLFEKFPSKNEGELTELTSKLVNRKKLNEFGEKLNLQQFIVALDYDFTFKNIFGNAFEAIIGAIYLDQGFERTKKSVVSCFIKQLDLSKLQKEANHKSVLIVWGQKTGNKVEFKGKKLPESNKYKSDLYINAKKISSTAMDSKKAAELFLAKEALEKITIKD